MEFTGERYIPTDINNDELSVEHLHRYYSIVPMMKEKVVLDIACGEGYGTALIANTAKSVIGVDISAECISHARQKYVEQYPNIRFTEGNIEQIPVEDHSIDIVVSFETIEHVSKEGQLKFLKEVKRVLTKEGILIISTPDKEIYSERYSHENHFHIHELNRSEFIELLEGHFSNAQVMEQGFEIVSIIAPADHSSVDRMKLVRWQHKIKPRKRKYLIAIASDKPIDSGEMTSLVLDTDKDFNKQIDRIIELQNEVEELSSWGLRMDKEREKNEAVIVNLRDQINAFNHQKIDNLSLKVEAVHQWLKEEDQKSTVQTALLIKELDNQKDLVRTQSDQISKLESTLIENIKKREEAEVQNKDLEKKIFLQQTATAKQELQFTQLEVQYKKLEEQYEQLDKQYKKFEEKNEQLEEQHRLLKARFNQEQIKGNKHSEELIERNRIVQYLQFNLSLSNQQLAEVNNKLITIYNSDGWKALEKYYNLKDRYLNESSSHYKVLRKFYNFLRNRRMEVSAIPSKDLEYIKKENHQDDDSIVENPTVKMLPSFTKPLVSIIIPVYNAWEMNVRCLDAIIKHTKDVPYEVIIADDCSIDLTKDIGKYYVNIVHIRKEKNVGFLLNCNHAAGFAKGKYIHFLNNDTEVKQGWLSSLVRVLDEDTSVGMVGSKLVYPDGKLQEAGGIIWNDASGWNYGHKQDALLPEFNYLKEVDYISGASILIRKSLWDKIGGFDEQYAPAYFEDTDLAFEVRKFGYKVMYQPLSIVVHFEGYSHGKDPGSGIKSYQEINAKKFYNKWKSVLAKEHFENAEQVFHARDKSKDKKTILVIDHYVPHFDKDAGSRHTFQYLKLFVQTGYNVKFIGDNFYKHEPYTTILQQLGIELLYGEHYRLNWQNWLLDNKNYIDLIYLHRPHIAVKYIDFIKANTNCKIVYFGHDLHFYREEKQYALVKDSALLISANEWKRKEISLFEKSDLILTPSEKEKEIIAALSPSYKVETIPLFYFTENRVPVDNFSERKDIMFIGGFNHLPNKDGVLWFLEEIWPIIKRNIPEVKFIIAGSNVPEEISKMANEDIEIKGYVTDDELENLYKQVRLVVVPLRFGAGIKGKVIEAIYNGVPVVTTSEGIEGFPGDISFMRIADDSKTFSQNLIDLYVNEESLMQCSKKGISYIDRFFSKDAAKVAISDLLSVPGRKPEFVKT